MLSLKWIKRVNNQIKFQHYVFPLFGFFSFLFNVDEKNIMFSMVHYKCQVAFYYLNVLEYYYYYRKTRREWNKWNESCAVWMCRLKNRLKLLFLFFSILFCVWVLIYGWWHSIKITKWIVNIQKCRLDISKCKSLKIYLYNNIM